MPLYTYFLYCITNISTWPSASALLLVQTFPGTGFWTYSYSYILGTHILAAVCLP
ncbi:uncharacterized protein C8R40DRAFT_1083689 [Lentinula edodes]|uniref:uncharacterized protein n=1 Tax=Lentinula edodes TaxID=5353 RepID=UPI001E8E33C7|nr:uncharacterized protein C8R40DRAFT_1083689 [Lentinula edodes]KAH7879928.1 hypothetical protein C8R40DRAFT_1083689 [Lentinula edodes]